MTRKLLRSFVALALLLPLYQGVSASAQEIECKEPTPRKSCVVLSSGKKNCICLAPLGVGSGRSGWSDGGGSGGSNKVDPDPGQILPGDKGSPIEKVNPPILLRIEPGESVKPGEIQVPEKINPSVLRDIQSLDELKVEQLKSQDGGG